MAKGVIKQIDLLDDLISHHLATSGPSESLEQMQIFRAGLMDILTEYTVEPYRYDAGFTVDVSARKTHTATVVRREVVQRRATTIIEVEAFAGQAGPNDRGLVHLTDYEVTRKLTAWPRRCRVCGCADIHACENRCWWVNIDLCSNCAGTLATLERT